MKVGQTGHVKIMDRWYKCKVHKMFSTSLTVILLESYGGNREGHTVNCDLHELEADK